MEKQEIIEGNKLIAEFMNVYVEDRVLPIRYHESWDWLMLVVEKIETLPGDAEYSFWILPHEISISRLAHPALSIRKSIKALPIKSFENTNDKLINLWLAVVDFIKWYNRDKAVERSDASKDEQGN